jgi:hypothetical protein
VPEVPVTVTVAGPGTAVLLAASVMILLTKDAVTPLGKPDAVKATLPVKPFVAVTVIVLKPLPP